MVINVWYMEGITTYVWFIPASKVSAEVSFVTANSPRKLRYFWNKKYRFKR